MEIPLRHLLHYMSLLVNEKSKEISRLTHEYEVTAPIQCVPDVVKLLSEQNVAVYQVIRYAKTDTSWDQAS